MSVVESKGSQRKSRNMATKEYALYRGEDLMCIGTASEIAQERNVQVQTILFYKTPSYQKRVESRKTSKNALVLVAFDDEE